MSETPPPPTAPAVTPSGIPAPKRRKWRRRLIIGGVVVLGVVVVGRLSVSILLPPVLRKVAAQYGLNAEYDRLELYALDGDVGLWNVRFTPLDGGPDAKPVLKTLYCRASISTWALLRGRLFASRIEAEDADLLVQRSAEGTFPLLEKFMDRQAAKAGTKAAPTHLPGSLDAPLEISVLRLQNGRAHFRDLSVTPNTDISLDLDMLVTNVGSATDRSRVELRLHSPEALAAMYVTATGTSRNNKIDADLKVQLYGLNPKAAAGYLEPLGIVATSADISAMASGKLLIGIKPPPPPPPPPPGAKTDGTLPVPPTELTANLSLADISLTASAQPVASVKSLNVYIGTLTPGQIRITSVDVDGVSANAGRSAAGRLMFAGLELGGAVSAASPGALPEPSTRPAAAASAPMALPVIELSKLQVRNVDLSFDDLLMAPPVHLSMLVPAVTVQNLSTDPAHADRLVSFSVQASSPGMFKTFTAEGTAVPAATVKTLSAKVSGTGVSPTAIAPYLAAIGITNELADAQFTCAATASVQQTADGTIAAGLKLADVRFVDGSTELFKLPLVQLQDLSVSGDLSKVRLGDAKIEGPVLPFQLSKAGEISGLGLRFSPKEFQRAAEARNKAAGPAGVAVVEVGSSARSATRIKVALPAFEIGKLAWHGAGVSLKDFGNGADGQPVELSLEGVDVDIERLVLDTSAKSGQPRKLDVRLRSPGVIEQFAMRGTVVPTGNSVDFDLTGTASGISAGKLRPFMSVLNVEPILAAGTLKFTAGGAGHFVNDVLSADLKLTNVELADGPAVWLGLGGLTVKGATFDGKIAAVESLSVDKPVALITRDDKGRVSLAGVRLLPPVPTGVVDGGAAPGPTQVDLTLPMIGRLGSLDVASAALTFRDAYVLPAADITVTASAQVRNMVVGEDSPAAQFDVSATSPGLFDAVKATGSFKAAPHEQSIEVVVSGSGLKGQKLEGYLPRRASVRFSGGDFAAKLAASLVPNPAGGSQASLKVTDAHLSDGVSARPVASVTSVVVDMRRVDLQANQIAIDEISVVGGQVAVVQDDAGVSMFGLTFGTTALRESGPGALPAVAVGGAQASDVNALVKSAGRKPPLITLRKLSIGADRLSLATPLVARELAVTSLLLTNTTPIELLGEDPTQRPPFSLALDVGVEKLIDKAHIESTLAPFAIEPTASATVDVHGIHGNELTAFLPKLAPFLDGQDLSNGGLTSSAEAQFAFTRRGALGIDLKRDITAQFAVKETRLTRNSTGGTGDPGEAVATLGGIRGEKVHFSPASGAINIKSIEVTKPSFHVMRDAAGVHVFGLTVKLPVEGSLATASPAAPVAATVAQPLAVGATAPSDALPSAEYRIDQFTLSGADIVLEDRVGQPVTLLPINDLDVEVRGLTTAALTEPKAIRFSAIVGAGKVPLAVANGPDGATEERPIFAEASASGSVVLVPQPKGYIKSSLSGLELASIRGLANQAGINLSGGTFDVRTDIRMKGTDTFDARVYPTFNSLRVSEPANGPIQRIFNFPAPLDVVVTTLEDADGSITFPVTVPLEAGKLNTSAVVGSAVGSVGRVVAEAMLAAPLKAGKLFGMLAGADTTNERTKQIEPVVMEFLPGESQLSSRQQAAIDALLKRMDEDDTLEVTLQHAIGKKDFALTQQRVNPLADDSLALAARLRQRRNDLLQQFAERSSRMRVAMASQNPAMATAALDALRTTSVELKQTEDGLDQILELLRAGADRQADRRTKAAALVLGDLRLQAVQQALLNTKLKGISDRVRKGTATLKAAEGDDSGRVTLALVRRAKQ